MTELRRIKRRMKYNRFQLVFFRTVAPFTLGLTLGGNHFYGTTTPQMWLVSILLNVLWGIIESGHYEDKQRIKTLTSNEES